METEGFRVGFCGNATSQPFLRFPGLPRVVGKIWLPISREAHRPRGPGAELHHDCRSVKTPLDGLFSRLGARDSPGYRNNGRRNVRRDEHPALDRHTRAHCPKDAPARHAPSSRRATHANAQWQTARPSRVPRAPDLPGNHPGLGLPQPCAPLQSLPSALRTSARKASTSPSRHQPHQHLTATLVPAPQDAHHRGASQGG